MNATVKPPRAAPRATPMDRLKDKGRRQYLRLVPTSELPAKVRIRGAGGWRLGRRRVVDISLGGLAVRLSRWEARRVRVGDTVVMELRLCDANVTVCGRAVHVSVEEGLFGERRLGLQFEVDASLRSAAAILGQYLLELVGE